MPLGDGGNGETNATRMFQLNAPAPEAVSWGGNRRSHRGSRNRLGPFSHSVVNRQRLPRGLLPAEPKRPLQAQPAHARAHLRKLNQIEHGAGDFVALAGIEQDRRSVRYFGYRRGVGAAYGRTARHRFEDRQTEALVERRETEELARVIELKQIVVRDESQKADAIANSASPRGFIYPTPEPRLLSGQNQLVRQVRAGTDHTGKSAD